MRLVLLLCFALLLLSGASHAQQLTIVHVNVVDVVSGRIQPDMTVVITGKRIARVSPSARVSPQSGKVVDATGQYLIPGLWDMHTHVYFDGTAAAGTDLILPLFVANGVTGIRDMGSELEAVLQARADVAAHRLVGPRMVVSGPMLDGPKSPYKASMAIATPEDGRKAVDQLKARGVDFIKVQSLVPREAYFAIAAEARKAGLPLDGHVPDAVRATEAITAGQRTFEHLIGIFEASSTAEDGYVMGQEKSPGRLLATYAPPREAAVVRLLAAHPLVWQCPTLFWERGQWLVDSIAWRQDPDLSYAGRSWTNQRWPKAQTNIARTLDTEPLAVRARFVTHELDLVRKLHAAHVGFLAGTDTPAGVDLIPGASLHLELQRFVAAGFTPLEALQTATLNPARFFKRTQDFGTVQAGRLADLVLLGANPLADIANTRSIVGVLADGQYFSPADLAQLRQRLQQVAAGK
ncbi:amidohydrolase family protein [Hymenobacter sp. BT770]|uniref:amidohydrolase family protein n=1 Tax=Hymenobacter sp. BT770 TaxID=2886942 RepID=UPI001D1000FC|nr:amidohydrolase family protein [Hymenobacter sp. BT770]MCC3152325.1 amidohydrolase family protein [Hymenobacter sp. BT770]MDO3414138.1 amidohydrolase family protein [Hymenobacter sp. BT770]